MRYAIIAAGEGSRLAQEGINAPKPLVKVNDEHLIDRLLRIFMANDAEEIVVICNDLTTLVSAHLADIQQNGLYGRPVPLRFIVKSTPSSMHSFFELSKILPASQGSDYPFVLTTVDTIFREEEFGDYIAAFKEVLAEGDDGMMGVTDYIDDEKPLYVEASPQPSPKGEGATSSKQTASPSEQTTSPSEQTASPSEQTASPSEQTASPSPFGEGRGEALITAFLDTCDHPHFISGGIYGLTNRAFTTLNACMERGESRMRNFQRALIRDGLRLRAYPFSKVLDIDHASDIQKAEEFLKNGR